MVAAPYFFVTSQLSRSYINCEPSVKGRIVIILTSKVRGLQDTRNEKYFKNFNDERFLFFGYLMRQIDGRAVIVSSEWTVRLNTILPTTSSDVRSQMHREWDICWSTTDALGPRASWLAADMNVKPGPDFEFSSASFNCLSSPLHLVQWFPLNRYSYFQLAKINTSPYTCV